MLRLFGKSTIVQVLVLLASMALMWARPLAHPMPMAAPTGYAPLYSLIYSPSLPPVVAVVLAILLVLVGGFSLNVMLVRSALTRQNNLLPTFLYCLFMSATATTLTPVLLASLLLLPMMNLLLLRGTRLSVSSDKIFGAAALIAIASMLYLPMLTLLLAYLLVVVNYRLYSWRDWMMLLLGLLAPYLLLWAILFLGGSLQAGFDQMAATLSGLGIRVAPLSTLPAVANTLLVAVLVASLVNLWRLLGENPVAWQRNAVTVASPALSGLAVLFYSQLFPVDLQLFAVPFALCGTRLFLTPRHTYGRQRRPWQTWGLDLLLILMLIAAVLC